jgi:hypothetical protein
MTTLTAFPTPSPEDVTKILVDFHHRASDGLTEQEIVELADFTRCRLTGVYELADTFETPYEQLAHLAGKPFTAVKVYEVEYEQLVDQENTPLFIVNIDGNEVWALPEEILAGHWVGYPQGKRPLSSTPSEA